MSNVTLTIGGRSYTVACAEGEESHVLGLGALIDRKLATMGDMTGQAETRTLLFASLLLADELHDASSAERQTAASQSAASPAVTARLEQIAIQLENVASQLER